MTRSRQYLFALAIPLAALMAATLWLTEATSEHGNGAIYETRPTSRGPVRKIVATSGPVRALVTVQVSSQLSGLVTQLRADFNSEVKEGDVMALIDDKSFVAKVAQAGADVVAARAQLANQQASLLKVEAVQRQAERSIGRQQALAAKGIATSVALEAATKDVDVAKAEIAVAKAQIENAAATIAQRSAVLEQAAIDLARTRIVSPINGTVISRTVDVGQTVAASLQAPELFKIAQDLRRLRIEAQVNEADIGAVAAGNPVAFTVDAYPDDRFSGKVTQIRLAATEINSVVTFTIIIDADNEDRRLLPGMTANVQIESTKRDNVLRIPNDALRYKPRTPAPGTSAVIAGLGVAAPRERWKQQIVERISAQLAIARDALKKTFERTRPQAAEAPIGQKAAGGVQVAAASPAPAAWGLADSQAHDDTDDAHGRSATIWILTAEGQAEGRQVRLGLADDQFTELHGGTLKEGELVIVRARDAKK